MLGCNQYIILCFRHTTSLYRNKMIMLDEMTQPKKIIPKIHMINVKAFHWAISSSINLVVRKSDLVYT